DDAARDGTAHQEMTVLGIDALIVVASSAHGPEGHLGLPRGGVRSNDEHDHLTDARAAREFLAARHEFAAPAGAPPMTELRRLRLLRDAVRSLVRGDVQSYARRRDALLRGARYRLAPDGTLARDHAPWTEFRELLIPPLDALGSEKRLPHACGKRRCDWLFADRAANVLRPRSHP